MGIFVFLKTGHYSLLRVGEIHSGIESEVGKGGDGVGGHSMGEIFDNVKYDEVCEADSVGVGDGAHASVNSGISEGGDEDDARKEVRDVCELQRVKTVNGQRYVDREKVDVTWSAMGKEVITSTFRLGAEVMAMWNAMCPEDALDTNTWDG